ncbi:hypothetical protein ACP4OV_002384 [Aristida adscensionis]
MPYSIRIWEASTTRGQAPSCMMAIAGAQNWFLQLLLAVPIFFVIPCPSCSLITAPTLHNTSEIDRRALLCLRSHLSNPAGTLDSWRNESLTFCDWQGVTCSTGHAARVVALDLASLNIRGQISPCIGDLQFLNRIHLGDNQISGQIPPEIGQLSHLKHLNLSMNSITGVIPDTISSCSLLEVIHLMNNSIEGEIPPSVSQLQLLQEINLSNNNLRGSIPSGIGLLPNLKFLLLPSNNLEGSIPESLGNSPSLSKVVLGNNSLTGGIPPSLANCTSLHYLDLMQNKLTGNIPSALFNSSSLATLELSDNDFSGPIPSASMIASPLKYISLARNHLSGDIPATLGNFSSLLILLLSQNNFQGSIPESLARIPGLQVLDMAYNNLSGTVPPNLYNVTSLNYLGLGVNSLIGRIPSDIGYTLSNIQTLVLEGNQFKGQLPVSLVHASNLEALDLRDNMFTGVVPSYFSLPNLIELDLGANQLETVDWSSLSSTTSSCQLQTIYLDHNRLHGELPNSIGNLPSSLQQLFLTENKFSGVVPPEIGNLTNLTVLQLEGNTFSGGIPDTFGNLGNLFVLSLARNTLSGAIPQSVGNLERLSELYLQENHLTGSIPPSLAGCNSLVMLNLSYNGFRGSIPPELISIYSLSKGLDLSYNEFTGPIPPNIGALINLGSLNISNNQLSGEIPHTLGDCLHLESIELEVNFLSGTIPASFISLRGIINMDLSQNNLSGEIPDFLDTFSTLQLLNLSFNNLEGVVPTGGLFNSTNKVFVQGNKKLCTNHPMMQLPLCQSTLSKRKKTSYIIDIAVPLAGAVIVLTTCTATILFKRRSHTKENVETSPEELKKFSYSDLAKATDGFSSANLVGSGRYGSVYKGTLKFHKNVVAIKVFKLNQIGAPKNFFAECEVLRNTRHRNLMRVISLCSSLDCMGNEFKALILEYMRNGDLQGWLHPKLHRNNKSRPLNLCSRIMIAIDIAAALDYLHNWCTPPLVHCDLKPSNILFDDDMVAHVSDFGLAKFLYTHSEGRLDISTDRFGPRGSVGYIAPEYGMGCQVSTAGDIYSYGVILLEMLTGKCPTDDMFTSGLNLHNLVESAFPQNIGDVLDNAIVLCDEKVETNLDSGSENQAMDGIQCCTKQLVKLGLKCSMDSPKDRPAIEDVYAEIISIKEAFSTLQGERNE